VPAPALYWSYRRQNLSIKEGVQRALKIMAVVPAPAHKLPPGTVHEVWSDENSARLKTSTFQVWVVCRSLGNAILTIIMVASHDSREAGNYRDLFRDVMISGNIGGPLE
jgi:hypothetical protein